MKNYCTAIFFYLVLAQPCAAQQTNSDSLLQTSRMYQRGKKNVKSGSVLLGIGTLGALVALMMPEERASGFQIGPSDKEVVYLVSGIVGGIGIINIIRGSVRKEKARAQLGLSYISYLRAPGQPAQMPAITLRLPLKKANATK